MTDMQRAVEMMTPEQMKASWIREQNQRRKQGLPHYTRLLAPKTGRIIATVETDES